MTESHKPSSKHEDDHDKGKLDSGLEHAVAQTLQVILDVAKVHPKMTTFAAVLALALVGSTVCLAFRFSPASAVIFMGIAVAAAHVLTPWLAGRTSASGNKLGRLMTWGFSLLLLVGAGALGTQQVMCQFGYACPLPSAPSQHVSFGSFALLNENDVDTSQPDHVLKRASVVTRDTVGYQMGTSPLVALATSVSNYSKQADGSIDVKIILFAGKDEDNLQIIDIDALKSVEDWKSAGMVQRYPKGAGAGGLGGSDGLLHDLRQQGLHIADDDLVVVSTVTCFPKDVLESKTAVFQAEVIDERNHTYDFTRVIPIRLVERTAQLSHGCTVG